MLLIRKGGNILTTVYRMATTNYICFNWKSFAPTTCKRGTLKTLVDTTNLICLNFSIRKKEIDHLKKLFHEKNDYLKCAINQILNEADEKYKTSVNSVSKNHKFPL